VDGQVLATGGELGYVVTDVNGERPSSLLAMRGGLHETVRLQTLPWPVRATPGDDPSPSVERPD
jgi:D-3-phosphoglycerate dehydrogenase